jgi:hypothetical protein
MKRIVLMMALCGQPFCGSSAAFQNLGFDNANTNNVTCFNFPFLPPICHGPSDELLPGWQLFNGNVEFPFIGFNSQPSGLGVASIYAFRPNSEIIGLYSLGLFPGNDLMTQLYIPQILVQVGDVPAEAKSIRFFNFGSPFELRVNNNIVPLSNTFPPDPSLPGANVAGDISAYAGMTVELKFITIKIPLQSVNEIDSIGFSTESVPEPGASLLLGAGLLVIIGTKWLRRIRK